MDMIKLAVQKLNLAVQYLDNFGSTTLCHCQNKKKQWSWPENYGENQFIIVLGELHIEMVGLK